MLLIRNTFKKKAKNKIVSVAFLIIKPFIVPIIVLSIFILIVSAITEILYISFDNSDEIDKKKELAYYDTEYNKEKDKKEVKEFFSSVWEFVSNIFIGEMSEETDWPVERIL